MIDPTTQEEIRTIVREEIALDEMRRLEAGPGRSPTSSCPCRNCPRAVPGAISPVPGTMLLTAEGCR